MIKYSKSPLAQSIILASGVSCAASAVADTITVGRCNDQDGIQYIGPSLRSAIAGASDFDTIDLTNIVCSTMTLERGEIPVYATGLKIAGPTSHTLTIDAHGTSRVFNAYAHAKYSPFSLYNLALTNGSSEDAGGCINGYNVSLESTTLTGCHAKRYGGAVAARYVVVHNSIITGNSSGESGGGLAGYSISVSGSNIAQNLAGIYGGGVYAGGVAAITGQTLVVGNSASRGGGIYADGVIAEQSAIWLNTAVGSGGGAVGKAYAKLKGATLLQNSAGYAGGGVLSLYALEAEDSTITRNVAVARGGGAYSASLSLKNSVVDGNSLSGPSSLGGGIVVASSQYYVQVKISNSTISGNHAHAAGAIAFDLRGAAVDMSNSTIAFNTADNGGIGGVRARACAVTLQSSIIAKNSPGNDFYMIQDCGYQGLPEHPVSGSNNIVVAGNFLPPDTSAEDPQLSPLAHHGGTVRTHALLATSPAINAGNNLQALATDARGAGFDRVVGASADIGAYERQINDDELFYGGFD